MSKESKLAKPKKPASAEDGVPVDGTTDAARRGDSPGAAHAGEEPTASVGPPVDSVPVGSDGARVSGEMPVSAEKTSSRATAPKSAPSKSRLSETVLDMFAAGARAGSEDEVLAELGWILNRAAESDTCDLFLSEYGDGLVLRASTHSPEYNRRCRLGPGIGLTGQVYSSGEPIFLTRGADLHPRNVQYPGLNARKFESGAILPLDVETKRLGVAMLTRETEWRFRPGERRRLTEICTALASVLATFQNAYQHGARASRIGQVSEVAKSLASSPYLEEILQLLVNLTAQQFNFRVCTVRLLDEERQELVLRATQSTDKAYQNKRAIKLGESIAGRAISVNRPIIVPDVLSDPEYIGHDLAVEQGLRSMICLPLTIQDRAVGVISCYTSEIRDFLPDEVSALEMIAKQAAVSIEHAKLQVRTTLMQEMHHRVKNNLQQVASLLRLQIRHGEYKSLEEALNDSLNRILAIAAVHELLSREDLDHVGVRTIAETLVQHQRESLMLPNRKIGFLVRGDDVHLTMTQGTQVALILNELIQNAIEHGFKNTVQGEIHVTVEEHDGEISLWVSNSGDPIPQTFDIAEASHLGLQIVVSLVRALGGRFTMRNILGWTVSEVRFHRVTGE
ncbi:MAG: GAF domain-containing protein [Fimbriimonadaceae bacterium]